MFSVSEIVDDLVLILQSKINPPSRISCQYYGSEHPTIARSEGFRLRGPTPLLSVIYWEFDDSQRFIFLITKEYISAGILLKKEFPPSFKKGINITTSQEWELYKKDLINLIKSTQD